MEQLRAELAAAPPLPGSFTPKTGDLCVAKFVDGEWYRAKVEKVHNKDKITVFFVDYGNVSKGTADMYALFLKGQSHLDIFSLVKGTIWLKTNCKFLLEQTKGTEITFIASMKYDA